MTAQQSREPTLAGVREAAAKVAAILPPTPLIETTVAGARVWGKAESLQPVGAFKIRGAWHRLTALNEHERQRGVVGVSSGNHAQGVAWAARRLGISATIVMPVDAPRLKLDATRALGAEIVLYDRPGGEDREVVARCLCEARGAVLVHAYGDPWVIEGQGSAGIEITRQLDDMGEQPPTRIITPCGGGGLSAGLALALPDAEIIPVEPEGWDDVCRSLASGRIERVAPDAPPTPCDALQTMATWPINFAILKARCPFGVTVSPHEVRAAQRFAFLHLHLHLVLEPGGAAALAAALAGKVPLDGRTVLMLTGGNTDPDAFAEVLTSAPD